MGRKINIHIDGELTSRKPKRADEPEESDLVYPTMLVDEAGFIRMFRFRFFRGDTRWHDDLEEWGPIESWLGANVEKVKMKWQHLFRTVEQGVVFNDIDYIYQGNNYILTDEQISGAYGPDIEDELKWDRLPLRLVRERDPDKRWVQLAGGLNIEISLRTGPEDSQRKYYVSPDELKDGIKKGSWRFNPTETEYEPDEYKLNGVYSPAALGISVREIGSKSICHYLSPAGSEISYGIDWLEPEGIYVCPFDTTDEENYKVTREPSYDSDAINGKLLRKLSPQDIEIYFIFRRWAYVQRDTFLRNDFIYDPVVYTTTYVSDCGAETWTVDNNRLDCPISCQYSAWLGDPNTHEIDCSGSWSYHGVWSNWDLLARNWCYAFEQSGTYTWEGYCKKIKTTDIPGYDPCPRGGEPCWLCSEPSEPCEDCFECYDETIQRVYQIDQYGRLYNPIIFTIIWAPPPIDVWIPEISPRQRDVTFYRDTPTGMVGHSITLIGDESYDDAVQHFIAAGGNPEDAKRILCGYTSLHLFAPSKWVWMRVNSPGTGWIGAYVLSGFGSIASGKIPFESSEVGPLAYEGYPNYNAPELAGFQALRQYIRSWLRTIRDPFGHKTHPPTGRLKWWEFEAEYLPEVPGLWGYGKRLSAESSLCYEELPSYLAGGKSPWGVGLSPMRAGTLCAVVRINNQPYFVWRKTDEIFTERYLHISGPPVERPLVGFDGPDYDPCYEGLMYFDGERRKLTHILRPKTVQCASPESLGIKQYKPPNVENCTYDEPMIFAGSGGHELEVPIYPIISREGLQLSPTSWTTSILKNWRMNTAGVAESIRM